MKEVDRRSKELLPPPLRYIREKQLLAIYPVSRATLWRKVKAGTFVQPVKLSERVTAWRLAHVEEWLAAQEGGGSK